MPDFAKLNSELNARLSAYHLSGNAEANNDRLKTSLDRNKESYPQDQESPFRMQLQAIQQPRAEPENAVAGSSAGIAVYNPAVSLSPLKPRDETTLSNNQRLAHKKRQRRWINYRPSIS